MSYVSTTPLRATTSAKEKAGSTNSVILWRKLLLQRRQRLTFICRSFENLWEWYFPRHDCATLQFKCPLQSKAESYWQCETWKEAARWYHENRQGRTLIVELHPEKLKRLRGLLSNDVSLDAAYRELNAPENRPTPQVTVEAIWYAVRERGLAALNEPATRARLVQCDAAALAELDRRITKRKERASAVSKAD
jgi:hypothetical protein